VLLVVSCCCRQESALGAQTAVHLHEGKRRRKVTAFIGLKPGKRLKVALFQSKTKTNENPYDARNHAATAFVAVGDSQ